MKDIKVSDSDIDKYSKDINNAIKQNEEPLKDSYNNSSKIEIPKLSKVPYIVCGTILLITTIFTIIAFVGTGFFKLPIIYPILITVIDIPVGIICWLIIIVKAIKDRKTIKNFYTQKFHRAFIIPRFFMENRRIWDDEAFKIEPDGKHFKAFDGIYCIDKECVWNDNKGRPHADYIFGMPNPLRYGFEGDIQKFLVELRKKAKEEYIKTGDSLKLSVMYDSLSLAMFKKDKFLSELHNPEKKDNSGTVAFIMFIVFVALFDNLILLVFFQEI